MSNHAHRYEMVAAIDFGTTYSDDAYFKSDFHLCLKVLPTFFYL